MGFLAKYQQWVDRGHIHYDVQQQGAVQALAQLEVRIVQQAQSWKYQSLRQLNKRLPIAIRPEPGIYLWGGVGRGKTLLLDLFYQALPLVKKKRYHFHRFMYQVHQDLTQYQGSKNPLKKVAAKLGQELDVLCFDEFFVSDIADAMLLGKLLAYLFAQGITLVATSNIAPAQLYLNGLAREQFLAAIQLLTIHTQIIHLPGDTDYRVQSLSQAQLYFSPLTSTTEQQLAQYFQQLAKVPGTPGLVLTINQRPIPTLRCAGDVVWFSFKVLCQSPRSQNDYIEIARTFHSVLVSAVPQLDSTQEEAARRFIALVDEFYERKVKLIMAAATDIVQLYQGRRLAFEFKRTISRLTEMQSKAYLARAHRA
jgi:cell division protein ZapE